MKAVLFGTYTSYEYHPLKGVDAEIKAVLEPAFEVTATEDMEIFNPSVLSGIDLLILYYDKWNKPIDPLYMAALVSHVSIGGKLLVIHNGISFQSNFEFMQMVGGRFDHHPEIRELTFHAAGNHPLTRDIPEFKVFDEPYQFEFCPNTPIHVFLEYEMDGSNYPAGWSVNYCLGKIVYLMPGHTAEAFQVEAYGKLIAAAAGWLTGRD